MNAYRRTCLAMATGVLALAPLASQVEPTKPVPLQSASAAGQGQKWTQEDLIAQRDAKLGEAWITKAPWIVMDLDKAKAEAKRSGRPIFAYFTRSYSPCAPCKMLESGALSDAAFRKFADKVVLFLQVATWVKGDAHQEWDEAAGRGKDRLFTEKGGTGFPHLVFLDDRGEVLVKVRSADRTVAAFDATADKLQALKTAAAKAQNGDAAAAVDVVIARMSLGTTDLAGADEVLKGLAPSPEQKARIEALRADLEFDALMAQGRELGGEGLGQRLLAMKTAGRIPTGSGAPSFWSMVIAIAASKKDVPLYEEALKHYRQLKGNDPNAKRALDSYEKRLAEIKAGG